MYFVISVNLCFLNHTQYKEWLSNCFIAEPALSTIQSINNPDVDCTIKFLEYNTRDPPHCIPFGDLLNF